MTMGKITITISDEVERRLRTYVTSKYPEKPYGKLSEIVEESLVEFLKKESK